MCDLRCSESLWRRATAAVTSRVGGTRLWPFRRERLRRQGQAGAGPMRKAWQCGGRAMRGNLAGDEAMLRRTPLRCGPSLSRVQKRRAARGITKRRPWPRSATLNSIQRRLAFGRGPCGDGARTYTAAAKCLRMGITCGAPNETAPQVVLQRTGRGRDGDGKGKGAPVMRRRMRSGPYVVPSAQSTSETRRTFVRTAHSLSHHCAQS